MVYFTMKRYVLSKTFKIHKISKGLLNKGLFLFEIFKFETKFVKQNDPDNFFHFLNKSFIKKSSLSF
jgi:hypothetical protein